MVRLNIGSRAQVMHGTAKQTSGGLTKSKLKYNKHGKIVSRKASKSAKKTKNLIKAGYITKKGQFGAIRRGGANTNILNNIGKVVNKRIKDIRINKKNEKVLTIENYYKCNISDQQLLRKKIANIRRNVTKEITQKAREELKSTRSNKPAWSNKPVNKIHWWNTFTPK